MTTPIDEEKSAMYDALSDILEARESQLLPEHREAAMRSLGLLVDPSTTDAEGDADRNARATGSDAAQAARGRELDPDADRRALR